MRAKSFWSMLIGLLLASFFIHPSLSAAADPENASGRLIVLISDLHLGLGGPDPSHDRWNPYEDFRWKDEFITFLQRINLEGAGRTDLILLGDTFELWQSRNEDCTAKDRGCDEIEAEARAKRVIKEHQVELSEIGKFADLGENSVTFVPGNHDAALFYPRVWAAVTKATSSTKRRVHFAQGGYWVSADGLVYADHGHQMDAVNRFDYWPKPFTKGGKYLQRPWGEQFVRQFYNRYEDKYQIVDNITSEIVAMDYALANSQAPGLVEAVGQFMGFYIFNSTWRQKIDSLGEEQPPAWDIGRARAEPKRFILESTETAPDLHSALQAETATFAKTIANLSDSEIIGICDWRWAEDSRRKSSGLPGISICPEKSLGAEQNELGGLFKGILRSKDAIISSYLKATFGRLSKTGELTKPFEVYVYAHTHLEEQPHDVRLDWKITVVNTGAWQRVVDESGLETIRHEAPRTKRRSHQHYT